WREALKGLISDTPSKSAIDSIPTLEKAVEFLEGLAPIYNQQAELMALPREEYEAKYAGFVQRVTAANPLAPLVIVEVDKLAGFERRHQATIALFKAAIAVAQGGP